MSNTTRMLEVILLVLVSLVFNRSEKAVKMVERIGKAVSHQLKTDKWGRPHYARIKLTIVMIQHLP